MAIIENVRKRNTIQIDENVKGKELNGTYTSDATLGNVSNNKKHD